MSVSCMHFYQVVATCLLMQLWRSTCCASCVVSLTCKHPDGMPSRLPLRSKGKGKFTCNLGHCTRTPICALMHERAFCSTAVHQATQLHACRINTDETEKEPDAQSLLHSLAQSLNLCECIAEVPFAPDTASASRPSLSADLKPQPDSFVMRHRRRRSFLVCLSLQDRASCSIVAATV